MNHTTNYQLNQWELHDRVMMQDFNSDNAKIDAALGGLATNIAKKGNCKIVTSAYGGNGAYGGDHYCGIMLTGTPRFVMVYGGGYFLFLDPGRPTASDPGCTTAMMLSPSGVTAVPVVWKSTGVSWTSSSSAEMMLNKQGVWYKSLVVYEL